MQQNLFVMHVLVFVVGDQVRKQLDAQLRKHIDFYEIGGRWSGILPRRGPAGTVQNVSSLCAGEIAWGEASAEVEEAARKAFGEWREILEHHGRPKSRAEIAQELGLAVDRYGNYPNEVYDVYRDQPALEAYDDAHPDNIYCPINAFGFDEEQFVRRKVDARLTPFAMVVNGEWIEGPPRLSDPDPDWCAAVRDRLRSLAPDTLVTAVDCHM